MNGVVMKHREFMLALMLGLVLLTAGCKNLFSSSRSTTLSRWGDYHAVESAFEKIAPNHTTVEDLRTLGFHPDVSANVKILTYVDIIQTFMPMGN